MSDAPKLTEEGTEFTVITLEDDMTKEHIDFIVMSEIIMASPLGVGQKTYVVAYEHALLNPIFEANLQEEALNAAIAELPPVLFEKTEDSYESVDDEVIWQAVVEELEKRDLIESTNKPN